MARNNYTKRVNYGTYQNTALAPEYYYEEAEFDTKPVRKYARQSKLEMRPQEKSRIKPVSKAKVIVYIVLVFGFMLLTVSRYAVIAANSIKINSLESQVQQQLDTNAQIQQEAVQAESIDTVAKRAQDELGMSFPSAEQIQYVDVPPEKAVAAAIDEEPETTNWFDALLDWFNSLERSVFT